MFLIKEFIVNLYIFFFLFIAKQKEYLTQKENEIKEQELDTVYWHEHEVDDKGKVIELTPMRSPSPIGKSSRTNSPVSSPSFKITNVVTSTLPFNLNTNIPPERKLTDTKLPSITELCFPQERIETEPSWFSQESNFYKKLTQFHLVDSKF